MAIDKRIFGYISSEEDYPDKAVIIDEGSKGDWIYIVLEGQAKVKKRTAKTTVTLDILKKGEIFGEMVLLKQSDGVRTASVVADGPVKVGVLDTNLVIKDYDDLTPQLRRLIRSLVFRLEETSKRIGDLVDASEPSQ